MSDDALMAAIERAASDAPMVLALGWWAHRELRAVRRDLAALASRIERAVRESERPPRSREEGVGFDRPDV